MVDVQTMILLFFVIVVLAAITVNLLYWGRLDPASQVAVDTFLDSFNNVFIFLETGDNWDSIVVNAYGISKWLND